MMLLFTLFSTNGAWALDNYSGNCGKTGTDGSDVTWTYNPDSKTLTISGTGEMADYVKNIIAQPKEIQGVSRQNKKDKVCPALPKQRRIAVSAI